MCVSHSVVRTIILNLPTNPLHYIFSNVHGVESDFWSLGVLAFELLFGQRPFEKHCPSLHITYLEESLKRTAARSVTKRDSIHVSIKCHLAIRSHCIGLHSIITTGYLTYIMYNSFNFLRIQLFFLSPSRSHSYRSLFNLNLISNNIRYHIIRLFCLII